MHEISLLEDARDILENHAANQNFTKVTRLTLEIGKLSCVEPDALRFAFDVVMKGSLAENAELFITELKGIGVCEQCGQQSIIEAIYDPCPTCGNTVIEIIQGLDMKVKDLLVV